MNQIKQLAGMRGLLANTAGHTIEMPIRANYREAEHSGIFRFCPWCS